MGAEADQPRIGFELLLGQLADVQFVAMHAHVGEGGVADVAVVRPDDRLRIRTFGREDHVQRVEHVRIAQIPRFSPAVVHDAIIALRRGD